MFSYIYFCCARMNGVSNWRIISFNSKHHSCCVCTFTNQYLLLHEKCTYQTITKWLYALHRKQLQDSLVILKLQLSIKYYGRISSVDRPKISWKYWTSSLADSANGIAFLHVMAIAYSNLFIYHCSRT